MTRLQWTAQKRLFLGGHGPGIKKHKAIHHSTGFHSRALAMEVDGGGHGASKKARKSEAQLIPGLGPLEWGFPNSIITKLRYCDVLGLSSGTGAVNSTIFRANGIYDPDYTNAGHQPMWRDNYAAIYDFYTVLGSKITVTFHSRSATNGLIVGIIGSDSSSLSSTLNTLLEQNNSVHSITGSVNSQPIQLEMTYSPMENLGADVKNEDAAMTAVGSDPSAGEGVYYYGVYVSTEDGASTAVCSIVVEIEYTVKFTYLSKQVQN